MEPLGFCLGPEGEAQIKDRLDLEPSLELPNGHQIPVKQQKLPDAHDNHYDAVQSLQMETSAEAAPPSPPDPSSHSPFTPFDVDPHEKQEEKEGKKPEFEQERVAQVLDGATLSETAKELALDDELMSASKADQQQLQQQEQKQLQEDMIKRKKEEVMIRCLKRRAELEAKRIEREKELAKQRQQEAIKREQIEQRKLEQKQKREAILEQYRQKKNASEASEESDKRSVNSNNGLSSSSSITNLNDNQSQQQPGVGKAPSKNLKSASIGGSTSTSHWTLYTGPKLFAKPTTKNNLNTIQNAILKALEGAANLKTLKRMQETIGAHSASCSHFLILFRNRHQFRGLYEYDSKQDTMSKLDGLGPKLIHNQDVVKYYKYDSPKRQFTEVQTRHMSLTIIAISIQDHLWNSNSSGSKFVAPSASGAG